SGLCATRFLDDQRARHRHTLGATWAVLSPTSRTVTARRFAERDLWNVRLHQSALAPENLTTLPHFSVSSAISFPKSVGDPANPVPPSSASRAFISASARLR